MLLYQILTFAIRVKNIKKSNQTKNVKNQFQYGTKNLNYLMDHILYQIFMK